MKITVARSTLELVEGDITRQQVDAIANAANSSLLGGGGVDGAIHRAGGPAILEECKKIGGCPTGEAVITTGGMLQARHVIHTVGPVWRGGSHGEAALLAKAYANSLALAACHRLSSIAFPSISTGAYGYPLDQAARIALATVIKHLRGETPIAIVRFVLFNRMTFEAYQAALNDLCADAGDMSSA
jgi:O-acetyl-ADP-ribose deacetylase (regulator of RNase III)